MYSSIHTLNSAASTVRESFTLWHCSVTAQDGLVEAPPRALTAPGSLGEVLPTAVVALPINPLAMASHWMPQLTVKKFSRRGLPKNLQTALINTVQILTHSSETTHNSKHLLPAYV